MIDSCAQSAFNAFDTQPFPKQLLLARFTHTGHMMCSSATIPLYSFTQGFEPSQDFNGLRQCQLLEGCIGQSFAKARNKDEVGAIPLCNKAVDPIA